MYNNDMLGTDLPWGPLLYNRLNNTWQYLVYCRYKSMVYRCENPNDTHYKYYGGVGVTCRFTSLSEYYNTLRKDPMWRQFKRHPEKYDIDKDIKCQQLGINPTYYGPDTIQIVSSADNIRERNRRCPHNVKKAQSLQARQKVAIAQSRPVIAVEPNGTTHFYDSHETAARFLGVSHTTVSYYVHHSSPTKGKYRGWTFREL